MPDPETVTRCVGAGVAFAGAFLVSPAGTRLLIHPVVKRARQAGTSALSKLRRWTPWLPWLANVPAIKIAAGGSVGRVTFSGAVTGHVWAPNGTLERKVELLHEHVEQLWVQVGSLASDARASRQDAEQALADAERRLRDGLDALAREHGEAEARAAQVDARALPVIGLGVLLSTVPDLFARLPLPSLYILLTMAVAIALRGVHQAWRDRLARVRSMQ